MSQKHKIKTLWEPLHLPVIHPVRKVYPILFILSKFYIENCLRKRRVSWHSNRLMIQSMWKNNVIKKDYFLQESKRHLFSWRRHVRKRNVTLFLITSRCYTYSLPAFGYYLHGIFFKRTEQVIAYEPD